MFLYTPLQWILFFGIYCFIGWCFESTYVSLKSLKFVNRGFLYGPFLPIYGSGAIVLLFSTIPVRSNYALTFLVGMIAATALEYVTGVAMEAIFKVRYWDYSYKRFHYKGHICLSSSIAWGVMAILLVNVIHKPIESLVLSLSTNMLELIVAVYMLVFSVDLGISTREALDFKAAITKFINGNEELKKLQKRMDVLIACLEDDKEKFLSELDELKLKYSVAVELSKQKEEALRKRVTSLKKRFPSLNNHHIHDMIKDMFNL